MERLILTCMVLIIVTMVVFCAVMPCVNWYHGHIIEQLVKVNELLK